jgi:hypothetical protein
MTFVTGTGRVARLAPHPTKGDEMGEERTTLTDEEIETRRAFGEPRSEVADADQDDPDADTADADADDTDADADDTDS